MSSVGWGVAQEAGEEVFGVGGVRASALGMVEEGSEAIGDVGCGFFYESVRVEDQCVAGGESLAPLAAGLGVASAQGRVRFVGVEVPRWSESGDDQGRGWPALARVRSQ